MAGIFLPLLLSLAPISVGNFKSDLHAKIESKMLEISRLAGPTSPVAQGPRRWHHDQDIRVL